MHRLFKIWGLFILVILVLNLSTLAQKIDPNQYENKAQAFAILSAQYSNDCYSFARENYFLTSLSSIKQNCDSGVIYAKLAMNFADGASLAADDTCVIAKEFMLRAKDFQQHLSNYFEQTSSLIADGINQLPLGEAMYAAGNAVADAYRASLEFNPIVNKDKENTVSIDVDENKRDVTRLESDEFSFVTIKDLYGKRLSEISEELKLLELSKNKATPIQRKQIDTAIAQLKAEQKELLAKSKNSENKLVKVRNELSDEMIMVVNKDMFTTNKNSFYNENVPIPTSSILPKGLVYRVQIGFFKKQLSPEHFDGVFPVSSQKVDREYFQYTAGNFSKYEDAKAAKIELRNKGYSDAFVVSFSEGEKIPISEALKIEKNKE